MKHNLKLLVWPVAAVLALLLVVYGYHDSMAYDVSRAEESTYTLALDEVAVGGADNLALGKLAVASSEEHGDNAAANAVDGDFDTRWSSAYRDYEWLMVDLEQTAVITGATLSWEAAYGRAYALQTSDDAIWWTTIYTTAGGDGGTDVITGLAGNGRYLRLYGIERATQWGFSVYEFEVYGEVSGGPPMCEPPIYSFETDVEGWIIGDGNNGFADSSATGIMTSTLHATDGDQSLLLQFDHMAAMHNKAVFMVEDGGGRDFSSHTSFNFDLWKSGQPTQVALAITTGANWDWHESVIMPLTDGENRLVFDLTSSDWKSAASGWEHTGTIANRTDVKRIAVLLFPGADGAGMAYLDKVQLCAPAEVPTLPTYGDPLFSFEGNVEGWFAGNGGNGYADSSASGVVVTNTFATEGEASLAVFFDHVAATPHYKATFLVESGTGWDFSAYELLAADVRKVGEPVQAALALATGPDWTWYESPPLPLYDGLSVLPFDLTASYWKSEATGWQYTGAVTDTNEVHRVVILLFPGADGAGMAYIDNVRPGVFEGVVPLPPARPEEFVSTWNNQFRVNQCQFYYAGTNNYYLSYKSDYMVNDVFETASLLGFNVIRTWGFLDYGSVADGGATVPHAHEAGPPGGIYFQYWDVDNNRIAFNDGANGLEQLDYVLYAARLYDIKLILPLVNNWRDFGGIDQYVMWHGGQYHDEFYTDEAIKASFKAWIGHLLNRVNVYTGIAYKDDPTIFAWELANEPRCYGTGTAVSAQSGSCDASVTTAWAAEMSGYIKSIDGKHLVAVGDEGHYSWDGEVDYPHSGYDGIDFDQLVALPDVDFGTVHMYPQHWGSEVASDGVNWGVNWIEEHVASANAVQKPVIFEEFGWTDSGLATRREAYSEWVEAIYAHGAAGDNFWMLGGRQDDGSFYPDFDGYTLNVYSPDLAVLTLHAADMNGKNAACNSPSDLFLPLVRR